MQGWLIVNGFIHTQKFEELFDWLQRAAKEKGLLLERKTNTELLPQMAMGTGKKLWDICAKPDFAIFWDKDVRLARLLEKQGLRLFNSADAIDICDDKARTFLELLDAGVAMPRTIIAPKTFCAEGYPEWDFLDQVEAQLGYPMVVKECYGSFGQQVHLVKDMDGLRRRMAQIKNRPCLFQQFIRSSSGHDIRIQMVGREPVAAMYRYHENDFRANITGGGSMKAYTPSEEQVRMARTVMDILGLDFAGVDILFGEGGQPVLCEVNSNAHFINIFQCTGVNAAEKIIGYCMEVMARQQ